MKMMITAIALMASPALVLASTPTASTPKVETASTTWNGQLTGVTAENQNMIKDAIAKIPGVEKVVVETTGKTTITGKSFTEAQVAAALPTGITVKK